MINGSIYIGKMINKSKDYFGSGIHLKLAISKYGKENFKRVIIDLAENRDDQNHKEKFWIAFYREKLGREALYNISDGGDGGCLLGHSPFKNKHHSVEAKRKLTAANSGPNNPNYGKRNPNAISAMTKRKIGKLRSEETKKKISQRLFGRKLSEETKQKMRKPKPGSGPRKREPIFNEKSH